MVSDIVEFVFVVVVGLNVCAGVPVSIWVICDYRKLQMYKYKGYDGIVTTAIGCLLFCIACLPWYYHKRRAILNGTARLHLKYAKEPPPLYVESSQLRKDGVDDKAVPMERRNDWLTRIFRKTISDSTRMEFLALWGGRSGNLFSSLMLDGLSLEACQIILNAFHRLSFYYAVIRSKQMYVTCYLTCPDGEIDHCEHLLNRLELLAKAHHQGQIDARAYDKMAMQIKEALDQEALKSYSLPNKLKLNSGRAMNEAAYALAEISAGAPQGWPGNESNPVQCPENECKPKPNPMIYSGKIIDKTVFEDLLREIEREWEISLTDENGIISEFVDENDKDAAYLDVDMLSSSVFFVLKKIGKVPPEYPTEWNGENDRGYTYTAMLNTALGIIRNALGSSIKPLGIDPETKLKKWGSFFQRIRIYDKLQRLEDNTKFTWRYILSLLLCFFTGLSSAWLLTPQTS